MARAYSLVELLLTIAAIVTLIGIIIPALARARVAAEWSKCKSNQRQMYQSIQGYIAEWDRYPIHRHELPALYCPSRDVTHDTMRKYVIWPVAYARPEPIADDDQMRQNVRARVEGANPYYLKAVEDIRTSYEINGLGGVLGYPYGRRNHHIIAFWDGSTVAWPSYEAFRQSERVAHY